MFPLLPPPRRRLRGGGRRGNRAQTTHGHQIFRKNLPGAALLPESARNRMVTTATQHLPAHGLSLLRALPAGDSHFHWGLIYPYHELTEFGEDVSRPLDQTVHPNYVANSVWQRAEARNRLRSGTGRTVQIIPAPASSGRHTVTARGLGPRNRGTLQRGLHQQTLTIARLNRPDTRNRAITARHGMTWTIQPATADMKLSDRKHPLQYRSAVTPSLPSHAVIIRSGLPLRPCILFRTPTHQTLRPDLNGLTPCARHHARLLAERRILSRDTASAAPPDSRNPHAATTSQSRLLPIRLNLSPRRRETRLTPGLPCQETLTTTARSLSLPPKTSRITRSLQSST